MTQQMQLNQTPGTHQTKVSPRQIPCVNKHGYTQCTPTSHLKTEWQYSPKKPILHSIHNLDTLQNLPTTVVAATLPKHIQPGHNPATHNPLANLVHAATTFPDNGAGVNLQASKPQINTTHPHARGTSIDQLCHSKLHS